MKTNLFSDFSPATKADWLAKIELELKGRPVSELTWMLGEEIDVAPFYVEEDGERLKAGMGKGQESNDWKIGEVMEWGGTAKALNSLLMEALMKGVEAPLLQYNLAGKPDEADWEQAFDQLKPEMIFLNLTIEKAEADVIGWMDGFLKWVQRRGGDPAALKGALASPAGASREQLFSTFKIARTALPGFAVLAVDGRKDWQGSNGVIQELYQLIKGGIDYLADWTEAGFEAGEVSPRIYFKVAVGTDYFVEIAKIRALHVLWANVMKAYGLPPQKAQIEGFVEQGGGGANTNMIRATTQAMSAVIGGVDRLYVPPANESEEESNAFTRRVARNVQHILKMESFLDRVVDPAAGSYYLEHLTRRITELVWADLQKESEA